MSRISNIAIHHSGGLGQDSEASSAFLTASRISEAHRARWDFPSRFLKDGSGKPWYAGYNVIYDPKDRSFTQTRAIGEETAAQYGFNFDTFSLCIIGNFESLPDSWPHRSVDPLTEQIKEDVTLFLHDLVEENKRGLFVIPGVFLDLDIARIHPHRFYQTNTECYGTFLSGTLFRDLLIADKIVPAVPSETGPLSVLERRNALVQSLMRLVARLNDFILESQKRKLGKLGEVGGRSCEGFINGM